MGDPMNMLATTTAAVAAIGGLGTAASGLVDATKAFNGGVSNAGFGKVKAALKPFKTALDGAEADWSVTIRANWINGNPKEDQKAAAKSLIRLGLSSKNASQMAAAGHVDPVRLQQVMTSVETGAALTPADVNVLGRFNGAIDAALDAGFEQGDQVYRNASKVIAGIFAIGLAIWAGGLIPMDGSKAVAFSAYLFSGPFWLAVLVGVIAVPIAPVAKDLTSSLEAAVGALKSARP